MSWQASCMSTLWFMQKNYDVCNTDKWCSPSEQPAMSLPKACAYKACNTGYLSQLSTSTLCCMPYWCKLSMSTTNTLANLTPSLTAGYCIGTMNGRDQGVTKDLETGGQNWGFLKFRGSKVSYPIYKNDHSNLIYWLSKTKGASLSNSMYLLSSRSETFEIFPWTQTNTENLAKYNWVSFSQKSCVWESKWLPVGCLGRSLVGMVGNTYTVDLHCCVILSY